MEIKTEIQEVLTKHKGLHYDEKSHSIQGELFISRGDSYEVLIELKPYPDFFPNVFEVGGRIPNKADRHIYTNTGSCCFTTRAKSQILLRTKITSLLKFVDEIVIRYFENNSYYEINGKYCFEEYSHGIIGVFEGYQDILDVKHPNVIMTLMQQRINNIKLRINQRCYCGSGRSLKRCNAGQHDRNYRNFRLIYKDVLKSDLSLLKCQLQGISM